MRDVMIGLVVVAAMSAAYLQTGTYTVLLPGIDGTRIAPAVSCVAPDPGVEGGFIVWFGYERIGGSPVFHRPASRDAKTLNVMDIDGQPLAPPEGLPTNFLIGGHPRQFRVRARDSEAVTWRVTSDQTRAATATRDTTPVCPPGR